MTTYRDLTPHVYHPKRRQGVNVGWLGQEIPFSKAPSSPELLERLWDLCSHHVVDTFMGWHTCEFCPSDDKPEHYANGSVVVEYHGKMYVAPTMIYHYVYRHKYQMPKEAEDAFLEP